MVALKRNTQNFPELPVSNFMRFVLDKLASTLSASATYALKPTYTRTHTDTRTPIFKNLSTPIFDNKSLFFL